MKLFAVPGKAQTIPQHTTMPGKNITNPVYDFKWQQINNIKYQKKIVQRYLAINRTKIFMGLGTCSSVQRAPTSTQRHITKPRL